MLKKITTLTLFMFLFITFSNALVAQEPEWQFDDDMKTLNSFATLFEGQTAITESEIKQYVKLLPKLEENGINEETIQNIAKANRIDPIRLQYIIMKTSFAILIDKDPEAWKDNINKVPEVLKPNKEEIDLINQYIK